MKVFVTIPGGAAEDPRPSTWRLVQAVGVASASWASSRFTNSRICTGRVSVSHACALGRVKEATLARTVAALAEARRIVARAGLLTWTLRTNCRG